MTKQSILVALLAFGLGLVATEATGQTYAVTPNLNVGQNPGGLNTESDSTSTGWTQIFSATTSTTTNAWTSNQTLPFSFSFYGQAVTDYKVSLNGVVTFDTATAVIPGPNVDLPTAGLPDNSICMFWDEFTANPPVATGDSIYVNTFGTAPNRQHWIKYFSYEIGSGPRSFAYWAVCLEETTSKIYVVDYSYYSGAGTTTVGVQQNPSNATQFGTSNLDFSQTSNLNLSNNGWYEFTPLIPGFTLSGGGASGPAIGAQTDRVVLNMDGVSVGSATDISSMTFTKTGTIADSDITSVDLYIDVNGDGAVNGGDTSLGTGSFSSGTVTFNGSPLHSVASGGTVDLILAIDTAGGIAFGTTFGAEIASAINIGAQTDNTNYPVSGGSFIFVGPISSYPFIADFETQPPYTNAIFTTGAQSVPTIISVGGTPGLNSTSGSSGFAVTAGPIAGSNPNSGSGMLDMFGGTGLGATSIDLLFDMSGFQVTDYVELEFFWNDEGIDNNASANALQGVFISTDNGANWHASVFQFPHSQNTGVWNQEVIDLSPIMSALSLSYTSQMIIRFQMGEDNAADHLLLDDIRIADPTPNLRLRPITGAAGDVVAGDSGALVAAIETFSLNSTQAPSSMTFTQVGSATNGDLTNLMLWEDTNTDGVFSTGDTQLGSTVGAMSGATVTFTGAPLRTYTSNELINLFITADISATPTVPGNIQFTVSAPGDVTSAPGPAGGTFPVDLDVVSIKAPTASFPYVQGFENAPPYSNVIFRTGAQTIPVVSSTVPSTPGTATVTGDSGFDVVTGAVSGSNPNGGASMLNMFGGTGTGATTMDLLFDMSAFSTSDVVDFEFYWNDEGIDPLTATDPMQGVFLSTDGGANWHAALFNFPPSQNTGVWNYETMDLSQAMTALSLTYTNQMVIRFQLAENSASDQLLIDDIRIEDPAPHLTVQASLGAASAAFAGGTDQVVAAIDTTSVNSTQDLDSISFTHIGTANPGDMSNLKLWEDTNSTGILDSGDTQLGSTVGAMSGSMVSFAPTNPLRSYSNNQSIILFVTSDIAAAPTVPANIQFSVNAVNDVTATPGYVGGNFPIGLDTLSIIAPVSSLPYFDDFSGPASNRIFQSAAGLYPGAAAAGATVTMSSFTNDGQVQITTQQGTVVPLSAPDYVVIDFPNGDAAAAMDLLFDLSAFNVATDTLDLSFAWSDSADETDDEDLVAVSTDGGASWIAVYKLDPASNTTGNWNLVTIDLTAAVAGAGANFTSTMIIRLQGQDNSSFSGGDGILYDDVALALAPAELRVAQGVQLADRFAVPGATNAVIGSLLLSGVNSNQTLDDITLANTGTLPDGDISAVRLWEDTNADNVFSTGDTLLGTSAFSGGTAFFSGSPLLTLNSGSVNVFVTADISATANVPDSLGVEVTVATDVTAGSGNVGGTFAVDGGGITTILQPATLPFFNGFENAGPYANAVFTTGAQIIPTVITVGAAPGTDSVTGASGFTIATGAIAGSSPNTGSGMLDMFGGSGTGATSVDFFLDMTGLTTAADVVLDFDWNDEGLDALASTDPYQGVFISTDGGVTWELAIYQFNGGGTEGIWNHETINLSTLMAAASLNYTSTMVLRFQMADTLNSDHLLLDDIRVEVPADLDVSINSTSIVNNGIDLVGLQPIGSPISLTYDLDNIAPTGGNDLTFTGTPAVQVGTTFNCTVNITAQPTLSVLTAGQSDFFDIDITPTAGGTFLVEILIASDDPDENPYQITIIGTGAEPEIDLQRPAGTSINNGTTDSLGGVAENVTQTLTYFIVNGGNAQLDLTGTPVVDLQATTNVTASVVTQPTNTSLSPAGIAPFDVEITPGSGAFSFTLTIANNDPDEGNYVVTVSGSGLSTPEIDIVDSTSTPIAEGGVLSLGNIAPGVMSTETLTIQNNGNMALTLTGTPAVQILSPSNVTAVVSAQPATTVAVAGSTTFDLQITPMAVGSFTFQVRVLNDDANEGAYTFTVSGFASTSSKSGSGSGDGGGGCSTGATNIDSTWALLLGALALLVIATRLRAARNTPATK